MKTGLVFGIVFFVLGGVLVILSGVLGWVVVPNIIDKKIEDKVILEPDGETFEKWANITLPIYLKFYVYNITNPDEFDGGNVNPVLQQLGPYSYRQTRVKENISFNEDGSRINYTQPIKYTFDRNYSSGSESDLVNTINMGFYIPIYVAHQLSPDPEPANNVTQTLVNAGYGLVHKGVQIRDLFFNGINYTDITALHDIPKLIFMRSENSFGYYYGENNTADGVYEIDTGKNGHANFGKIYSHDGETVLSHWRNEPESCNMINGSDASIFPPFVKKDRIVEIFNTDVCRSFYLTYDREIKYKNIPGYRFVIPKEALENPIERPENSCFCLKDSMDECPSGVIDVGYCKFPTNPFIPGRNKLPLIMSTPHFLDGFEGFINLLDGISPNREDHQTFIDLEPNSGILLRAHKRIQVNVDVTNLKGVQAFENITPRLVPVFWADEEVEMDDNNADDLKSTLITPLKAVKISKWTIISVGSFLAVVGLLLIIFKR